MSSDEDLNDIDDGMHEFTHGLSGADAAKRRKVLRWVVPLCTNRTPLPLICLPYDFGLTHMDASGSPPSSLSVGHATCADARRFDATLIRSQIRGAPTA